MEDWVETNSHTYAERFLYAFAGATYECNYTLEDGRVQVTVDGMQTSANLDHIPSGRLARILVREILIGQGFRRGHDPLKSTIGGIPAQR
jgi:hypothetical protein